MLDTLNINMKKNILILGKGGREHALARKCKESKLCNQVFVIPGNDGIKDCAIVENNIDFNNMNSILEFALHNSIDLTIVGDEAFLANGVVDLFEKHELKIFGPSKQASQIEASKIFSKTLMQKYKIPTANFFSTTSANEAIEYLKYNNKFPIVIKNDGLASGKGVFVTKTLEESIVIVKNILEKNIFNNDKQGVVIEEFLEGKEFSHLALVNGDSIIYLQPAKDYKKIYDNDLGENTGGMGCYTPVDYVTKEIIEYSKNEIIKKTIEALKQENIYYKGVLYAGLILTKDNQVKVIEFNSRFGDPETEVLMPALESDLIEIILNLIENKTSQLLWSKNYVVGITIASQGYPKSHINNLKLTNKNIFADSNIFHMGTTFDKENNVFNSNGGRVLFVYNQDLKMSEAVKKAYKKVISCEFENFYYRKDIGK
ncbi:phosphoribosylamine---glycine ligase [Spiroplasma gladiatoris]|uniref:Phosphoribosylamine--glycine ligase n=1 Tax=Spiroplasma gladiatoris TaxID=2143 RepID=A0A4P7AK49_9MOLU|nr:phosphoribosylamine--glycine ligase [Spiroplasma gladiatoris]QBQ08046.1 phosphoribosylamine---glycine ligase [Spiroplasma gladiatoris]